MTEATTNDVHIAPTYAQIYIAALNRRPDHIAFQWNGQTLTYRGLRDQIYRCVQAMKSLGLERGDTVAHLGLNTPAPIVTWVSCSILGLRYTPLNPYSTAASDQFILKKSDARAVVVDGDVFAERASHIESERPNCLILNIGGTHPGIDFAALCESQPLEAPQIEAAWDDVIALFFTGGTTGEPKGVMHSSRSLANNALVSSAEWPWPARIDFLVSTPISHASGYMVLPVLMRGGTIHLRNGFSPAAFVDDIKAKRVNSAFLVPTMIQSVLEIEGLTSGDFRALEFLTYGAAPIDRDSLVRALSLFGPVMMQGYGQTEAPNALAALLPEAHVGARLKSCGMPLAGNTVAILGPDGSALAANIVGEICAHGPLVMEGYLDNPEETKKAVYNGWLHTGDVGYLDEDGYLYIVDRMKDMIITGGFNVFPSEVEACIATHPAVDQVAVVGLPDSKWGETVTAAIWLKSGHNATHDEIAAIVRKEKGTVQAPKKVIFMSDPLPLTGLGKPDKKRLQARLLELQLQKTV